MTIWLGLIFGILVLGIVIVYFIKYILNWEYEDETHHKN